MRRKTKIVTLGEALESFLAHAGLSRRIEEQKILDAWGRLVGEAVASHTQPLRVRNRVLQVKVVNSVWMHQLVFMKDLIIQKLRSELGEGWVEDLRFYLGEIEAQGGKTGEEEARDRRPPPEELTPEEKGRIEEEIEKIGDPEMKEILGRLFVKGLKKGKR